jgi:hypothetical protein
VGLTSPSSGSLVRPNGPVFAWTAVGHAVRYKVEARRVGETSPTISATTAATSYAATTNLLDSRYEWRVTAYDTSNGALAASPWRGFLVDTAAPKVIKRSPGRRAKPTSNFVATFSEPVSGVSSATMRLYVDGRTTPLRARVTINAKKRIATLNPAGKLKRGKRYRVTLTSGIRDLAGLKLRTFTWKVGVR